MKNNKPRGRLAVHGAQAASGLTRRPIQGEGALLSIRKIGVVGRTYRHLNRYRQILTILFKYGFGNLVERLKIEQYLEIGLQLISRKRRERLERLSRYQRLRMAFEELGPTFIKLAQVLSSRPDLVPVPLLAELAKLQDKVLPCSFEEARSVLEEELGAPLEDIYDDFNPVPLASASIGQVYRAHLKNGESVAVKVQRPGIRKIVEVDLEIMLHLATLMERHVEEMAFHRPVKVVEEFAKALERELDYLTEAANGERFARNFLTDPTIYIPAVYRSATTSKVLTMEFVGGIKISDLAGLEAAGIDRRVIVSRGADCILKQIFEHGFFHSDPHPGNLFVLPGNVVCLLDFGQVGSIDQKTKEDFVDLVDCVVHRRPGLATRVLLRLSLWEEEPDLRQLEKDVDGFMSQHLFVPLKDIRMGKLLQDLLELAARHRMRIQPDLFLMMKALGTIEGIGALLHPEFDMISQAEPFVRRVKLNRYNPRRLLQDLFQTAVDLKHFSQQFPQDVLEITRLLRQKKLPIRLEHQGLPDLLATHDQISNRIAFSIIIAALIIGSALIVVSDTPPLFYGISLIGIIGFLAAAVMGFWLLIAILRKGKL